MKKIFCLLTILFSFFLFDECVNAQVIEDGTYTIQTALDNSKYVDLPYGRTVNCNNIQIFQGSGDNNQKWNLKHIGNDYYTISSYNDDKMMIDVYGSKNYPGSNVQLYASNGGDNQKWLIKDAGNGYYYLVSKKSGLYLDVSNNKSVNGTNIAVWSFNGGKNQKFKFIPTLKKEKPIEDGIYSISNFSSSLVMSTQSDLTNNLTNVFMSNNRKSLSQLWDVKYKGDGYYTITNYLDSSKVLDVFNGNKNLETNVDLFNSNGGKNQKWAIIDKGDGTYNIVSALSDDLYLDIYGGNNAAKKNNIQLYTGNNGNNQKFKFTKEKPTELEDGIYTINSKSNPNMVLGINTNSPINSSNVLLQSFNNSDLQKWKVTALKNGYYKITSAVNSSKSLDVNNFGKTNGTNVGLFDYKDSANQKWLIKYVGDGYYKIISDCNSLVLDINGAKAIYGANINMWTFNGGDNQRFSFNKVKLDGNARAIENGYYTIKSADSPNLALDVHGAIKANETNVELFSSNGGLNQVWYFKYLNNGYYSVTSAMNRKVALDMNSSNNNVQIYEHNGGSNQNWIIRDNGDGTFSLVSQKNGYVLTVNKASSGSDVYVSSKVSSAFKLKLDTYTAKKVYTGIDISEHNGYINWDTIGRSNLGFVNVRLGYGGNYDDQDDEAFLYNIKALESYNIPYSVYLYSYALNTASARSEVEHALRLLKNVGDNFTGYVWFDMEDADYYKQKHGMPSDSMLVDITYTFCDGIERAGYKSGVYASLGWLNNKLNSAKLDRFPKWVAQWKTGVVTFDKAKVNRPDYNKPYKYWQFCSDGYVNGLNGRVDSNLGYDIFD